MWSLIIQTYIELVRFDFFLLRADFSALYDRVRVSKVRKRRSATLTPQEICSAVDNACVFYGKEVLCLQRSASTVCLLRRYGFPAELVIGAQHTPFRAHAWAELAGSVINDKPYVSDVYAVVDRC